MGLPCHNLSQHRVVPFRVNPENDSVAPQKSAKKAIRNSDVTSVDTCGFRWTISCASSLLTDSLNRFSVGCIASPRRESCHNSCFIDNCISVYSEWT